MDANISAVRTFWKYWIGGLAEGELKTFAKKFLANESIEQVIIGPIPLRKIQLGDSYAFQLKHVDLREATDDALVDISRQWQYTQPTGACFKGTKTTSMLYVIVFLLYRK